MLDWFGKIYFMCDSFGLIILLFWYNSNTLFNHEEWKMFNMIIFLALNSLNIALYSINQELVCKIKQSVDIKL